MGSTKVSIYRVVQFFTTRMGMSQDAAAMIELSVPPRLRRAILRGDALLVKRIVKNHPKYLHNPDYDDKSNTSLHLAAALGHLEVIKVLVEAGHDACTPDISSSGYDRAPGISLNADSSTPLHLAAAHAHADCVDYLCTKFPQTIDRRDKNGATPLMLAARSSDLVYFPRSTNRIPPTRRRRSSSGPPEDTSTVVTLLLHKASVTITDNKGNTALHYASAWGNLKAFRLLVSAGAPPLAENDAGWKAADYASTMQAATYFRALVSEFEQLKAEEPPLTRPQQMPVLKLRTNELSQSPNDGRDRSSPISPCDRRDAAIPGSGLPQPAIDSEGFRQASEGDESSEEEIPLTARKISMSDEDPFSSFSGSYGNDS
ncbi:hypothetical protein VTO42DRAFT_1592 [Malbranchea cinnamomea]